MDTDSLCFGKVHVVNLNVGWCENVCVYNVYCSVFQAEELFMVEYKMFAC